MRKISRSASWIFGALTGVAASVDAVAPSLLDEARTARGEDVPQIAVQKLQAFLAQPNVSETDRDDAIRELAEALLDAGDFDEALATIQPKSVPGSFAERLLEAHILASSGRWSEALPIYEEAAARSDPPAAATLGLAESFAAQGETAKAIAVLDKFTSADPSQIGARLRLASLLVEAKDHARARAILETVRASSLRDLKWKSYVEARLLLLEEQFAPALAIFEELLRDANGLSESLLFGAALGSSEARVTLNGYDAADTVLEKFIWVYPSSAYLELAFQQLDRIYAQQEHPTESELGKWMQKGPPRRAALAQFYRARMQVRTKRADKARATLDAFVQTYPSSALLPAVHLLQADLRLEKNDLPGAVLALEAAMRKVSGDEERAEIEMRTALVNYRQGEPLLAANLFRRVAERSAKLRAPALFNAALADLKLLNYERFEEDSGAMGSSPLLGELLLEKGLAQLRASDGEARDTLTNFLRRFPAHARRGEAQLALAEFAFQAADAGKAAPYLQAANESSPPRATAGQAAHLAIFMADSEPPKSDGKAIGLAQEFLRAFAGSPLRAEVRMKLGQIYFRSGDAANAETQFTLLARESPASEYSEAALFLAGQAAMKTINPGAVDRALALFGEVVRRDAALKLYARQQQAIVQSQLGKNSDAIVFYDAILSAEPPPDAELRFAAMNGKGYNLLELGRTDPEQLEAAIAVFDQLAALPGVTPAWRNQALYKKAQALTQLGRGAEGLAALYDVLEKGSADAHEFFWFYKAGFDAARQFEQEEKWKPAIGIYEKMARTEGLRAAEAKSRASQLRLEHFIWE